MLGQLGDGERQRLVGAMATIERLLGTAGRHRGRRSCCASHRPGDIGWVVASHGAIYAQEYGWDISFEALVAEIAAQFIRSFDRLARTLLDRGDRRRAGRLDLPGQALGRGRETAAAAGGEEGARPGVGRG